MSKTYQPEQLRSLELLHAWRLKHSIAELKHVKQYKTLADNLDVLLDLACTIVLEKSDQAVNELEEELR